MKRADLHRTLVEHLLAALALWLWRVPLVLTVFVLASIVSVPILALIGATVVTLGPLAPATQGNRHPGSDQGDDQGGRATTWARGGAAWARCRREP